MEELASVYARSLFEAAKDNDDLDTVREQLGQFADALAEARRKREEMMEQTRREIQTETQRALGEIRSQVADLTVLATEKVTRKSLSESDQQRLVEEALNELDFAALAGDRE